MPDRFDNARTYTTLLRNRHKLRGTHNASCMLGGSGAAVGAAGGGSELRAQGGGLCAVL